MDLSRRDFMKLVGISVASLALTRCRALPVTCYTPLPPYPTTTELEPTARERLRMCWLSFGILAQATIDESNQGTSENLYGQQLSTEHRRALDELLTEGLLTPAVADLVQEAFDAAVYHIWRSNAPITCYEPMIVDYAPVSASVLVQQSEILQELARKGTIDQQLLSKAQAALEHDMAYYALTDEELSGLYDRLMAEWERQGQTIPSFDEFDLEVTPEAQAAAQFIINLLTQK
jgi:hypothetical protein